MNRILFTAAFSPYGVRDEYGEELGMQMELLNNQVTREQGVHSPRQSYLTFALYLLAENISVPSTVLDFPTWEAFVDELEREDYTHVAISFIVPNVLKVKRMAEYIRSRHPQIKILLGGYGTIIPEIEELVPHDARCQGEGVRWLREYFGDDPSAPINHPILKNPVYNYVYGLKTPPRGSVIFPGVGCENGCKFCITSHMFKKEHVSLLPAGRDVFDVCRRAETELGARHFMVLDENFLKHDQRARELLEEMTDNRKPYVFVTFSSAENIRRMGADFMVRAGISRVWVGVESKRNLHDKTKGIDLKKLFAELQAKGIAVLASTILFHDHHDRDTIREEIDWVCDLDTDMVQFMNYHPWPGTPLYAELDEQGRLRDVAYRHHHVASELSFEHPHFKTRTEHESYLRQAFRRKYVGGGPAIVNLAATALNGYEQGLRDFEHRAANGLCWNQDLLRYEKSTDPRPDEFMRLRLEMIAAEARRYRPSLLPALIFAPNNRARRKTLKVMRRYRRVFGRSSAAEWAKATVLSASATLEFIRLQIRRLAGHETVIRQPPVCRREYPGVRQVGKMPGEAEKRIAAAG